MKYFKYILATILSLYFVMGCTSARWTVKEKESVDKSEYELINENLFLQQQTAISTDNPVLTFQLFSESEYEYPERVLMQRNIQDYQLRPGTVALGVSGAAMAFYIANFGNFENNSSTKTWALNGAGAAILASGFLNMKPKGEPRPTGEERYLRRTGTTTQIDTVQSDAQIDTSASVYMLYNDLIIYEENDKAFTNSTLNIPVGDILDKLQLSGQNPGNVTLEVLFADSLYQHVYPIDSVLEPYAVVNNQLTALRNSPEEADNVLADLVEDSQLKIDEIQDEWYKVLYGISETYIKKSDAKIIWRSEDYEIDDQVVTVPRVPFGEIDVESNIPVLREENPNAKALLVINQNYADTLDERNYALRDGRLIRTYLQNSLGYAEENIHQLADIPSADSLNTLLSSMQATANDSTEFFIYLSGYGTVDKKMSDTELGLLPVTSDTTSASSISLPDLFRKIGQIPSQQTVVLNEIDFKTVRSNGVIPENEMQQIIQTNTSPLLSENTNSAVLMGATLNSPSSLYMSADGEDKKHHIFPYFFAKALQERRTTLSDIYQYLERNVSYTSRRLFDRPQEPLLLGNTQLNLAGE